MDYLHEFYLKSVQTFPGRIQIRHWFDLEIYKDKCFKDNIFFSILISNVIHS